MNDKAIEKLRSADAARANSLKTMSFTSKIPLIRRSALNNPLFIEQQKENARAEFVQNYIDTVLKDFTSKLFTKTVPYGIFKDTKITSYQDLQAGIAQKVLGIYEFEIAPYFSDLLSNNKYDYFIDIGAAEGLYAMVFDRAINASGHPASIYAFEQDYCTRALLRKRIEDNNATNVKILDEFSVATLNKIDLEKRGFILSDCEGFEAEIFTDANLSKFVKCDLIIETHDNFAPNATQKVIDVLSKTHNVTRVDQQALSDGLDLITDDWFNSLPKEARLTMLEGGRHPETRWVVATIKG